MPSVQLKAIPEDVLTHVLKEQLKKKLERKRPQYSLQDTIYAIIREHKDLKK